MLLIIPTIQKIVRTAATGPANRNAGPPSGLAMKSIDPGGDRGGCEDDLAEQLPACPQVEEIVDRAGRGGSRPADQERRHLRWRQRDRHADRLRPFVDNEERD